MMGNRSKESYTRPRTATSTQFWTSILYYISFISLGLFIGSPGPILKELQIQTNASLSVISYLFSARAIGYIFGSILHGRLSDTYATYYKYRYRILERNYLPLQPHFMYFLSILVCNACFISLAFIRNIYLLYIVVCLSGVCMGAIDTYGNVCLLALFDTNNKRDSLVSPYMQFLHFSFAIGAFLSPLLIQFSFLIFHSYSIAFWMIALTSIPVGAALMYVPTPLRKRHVIRTIIPPSSDTTDNTLNMESHSMMINDAVRIAYNEEQKMLEKKESYGSIEAIEPNDNGTNSTNSATSSSTHSSTSSVLSSAENHSAIKQHTYRLFIIAICAAFLAVYVGSEVGFAAYITTYSIRYMHTTAAVARYINSAFWGGLAVGRLFAVPISKYMSPITMLVVNLIGCLIISALFIFYIEIINEYELLVVWIVSISYGFFMSSVFPCIFLIAENAIMVSGKFAALMMVGSGIGSLFLPTIEGNIMAYLGVGKFAYITFSFACILLIMFIILMCIRLKLKSMQSL